MAGPNNAVKADAGVLKELGVAVDECQNGLNRAVSTLEREVAELRPGFQGGAAIAFQGMVDGWRSKATRVVGILQEFEREIDATDKENQAQDAAQSAAYNALMAKLDG